MKNIIVIVLAALTLSACQTDRTLTTPILVSTRPSTQTKSAPIEAPTVIPATAKPVESMTPTTIPEDQQTLSTERDSHVACTWEDFQDKESWFRKAIEKAVAAVKFPPLAMNPGWEVPRGADKSGIPIAMIGDSVSFKNKSIKLVSVCYMPGDFLGYRDKEMGVATFAVLNTDKTVSYLSIAADSRYIFTKILDPIQNNENSFGFVGWVTEKSMASSELAWNQSPLLKAQGGKDKLLTLSQEVITNGGVITEEMEDVLWLPALSH